MKKISTILFIFLGSVSVSYADNYQGLQIFNNLNNQYNSVIINKNAQIEMEIPNNAIQPIKSSKVPYYSYFYNGQYSIIDLQCNIAGNFSSSDIYIKYDDNKGIQSVNGVCQIQLNGQTVYVTPIWDGEAHGTIMFNTGLKNIN